MARSNAQREAINKDIERMGEVIGLKLSQQMNEMMRPIAELTEKLAQTTYGPNNDNGLCGDMKVLKEVAQQNQKAILVMQTEAKVRHRLTWTGLITGSGGLLAAIIKEIFGKHV